MKNVIASIAVVFGIVFGLFGISNAVDAISAAIIVNGQSDQEAVYDRIADYLNQEYPNNTIDNVNVVRVCENSDYMGGYQIQVSYDVDGSGNYMAIGSGVVDAHF